MLFRGFLFRALAKDNMKMAVERYPADRDVLNGIYELIVETVVNQSDTFVIASNKYPMNLVRSKFMKLDSRHIEYVMECLLSNTTNVFYTASKG